jgi:Na+/melibiose symporter-like transporter
MTYIFGLIIIGLFFLALHYFTDLNHAQKWWVTTTVLAVLSIAVMFNQYNENNSEKILDIQMRFNQGKTIKCENVDVNSTNFTLSTGTYTFIGKEGTANYAKMISLSDCE